MPSPLLKTMLIGALLIGTGYVAFAANLTVVSPTVGALYQSGDVVKIQWAETAPLGSAWVPSSVSIALLRGGAVTQAIGTAGGGQISMDWIVPAGLNANDFQIQVTKLDTSESAVSGFFEINPGRYVPISFGTFSPQTGKVQWRIGQATTITWQPTQGWAQAIEFHVVSSNGLRSWLAGTASDMQTETTTFVVPASIIPGTYYIEVREQGAAAEPCLENDVEVVEGHCTPEPFRFEYLYRTESVLDVSSDPGPYPDGTVVREQSSPEVWILKVLPNGRKFKRHVITPAMASWYGHWGNFWSSVRVVPDGTLSGYTLSSWIRLPLPTNSQTWKIYEVNDDMTKHWIECPSYDDCALAWFEHGGEEAGVYTVNGTEINAYTNGPNVFITTKEVEHDHGAEDT